MAGRGFFPIIRDSFHSWSEDDAFSESASIAYYAILSLPGLIVLLIYLVGFFFGDQIAQGKVAEQINQVAGPGVGKFIQSIVAGSQQGGKATSALIIGLISIGLSATAVFIQLQKVLNKIWKVKPESSKTAGVITLLLHRLISFGLIVLIGMLLVASIVLASALNFLKGYITSMVPGAGIYVFYALSFVVAFFLLTLLFAMIFKFLPDAKVAWKAIWKGAFLTSFLFIAGTVGLQFYFSVANPASGFGAASAAVLILLWSYYSSLIFLLGAEFTKVYARSYSGGIIPSHYATRIAEC